MQQQDTRYWFKRKKIGIGWGAPCRWQGWVTLLGFIGVMIANAHFLGSGAYPVLFAIVAVACVALFLFIVVKTGEPIMAQSSDQQNSQQPPS